MVDSPYLPLTGLKVIDLCLARAAEQEQDFEFNKLVHLVLKMR